MAAIEYTTAADIQRFIDFTDATALSDFVTAVTEWGKAHIRPAADQATGIQEIYRGNGSQDLYLRRPPVTALTTIEEWSGTSWLAKPFTQGIDIYVDYDDYASDQVHTDRLQTQGLITWRDYVWLDRVRYRVKYTGGLATSAAGLPDSFRIGFALIAAELIRYKQAGGAQVTQRTLSTGDSIFMEVTRLAPPAALQMLEPWRTIHAV